MSDSRIQAQALKNSLDESRRRSDRVMGCVWGAVDGTAPRDRWDMAAAHLREAAEALAAAAAVLAAMDKEEPYCTACGEPILNLMAGWSHFDAEGPAVSAARAGHKPELDWRPIGEAGDA